MSYWDTSALLKLYLQEADSAAYVNLAANDPEIVTAFIGKHEARAAFRRREAEGVLTSGGGDACYQKLLADIQRGRIRMIPETADLESGFGQVLDQCFSQAPPLLVRTNDALHLAAARLAGEQDFHSADARQRAAATLLGFKVHP